MAKDFRVYFGSMGSGVFASSDGGHTFSQSAFRMPVPPWGPWIDVRAVEVSPHDPKLVLAGSHIGVHLSEDGGKSFDYLPSPMHNKQVWAVSWHPADPDLMFVGIAGWDTDYPLFRSKDRGKTWEQLPMFVSHFTPPIGASHVTKIAIDPADHDTIWVTCEIYGTFVSHDRGDSWKKITPLGSHVLYGDNHSVAVHPAGYVYVTSPLGIFVSWNRGESFERFNFPDVYPFDETCWLPTALKMKQELNLTQYVRHIALNPKDPDVMFVGTGDNTPGVIGDVQRSLDAGKTWETCQLPARPNSHVNTVAVNPDLPGVVACASLYGQVYVSTDNGENWIKGKTDYGEIRGLAIGPAV